MRKDALGVEIICITLTLYPSSESACSSNWDFKSSFATYRVSNSDTPLSVFEKALMDLKRRNITVIVHTILGLPLETKEDTLKTIDYLSKKPIDGIKLQLLHVLKGTDLANYLENETTLSVNGTITNILNDFSLTADLELQLVDQ